MGGGGRNASAPVAADVPLAADCSSPGAWETVSWELVIGSAEELAAACKDVGRRSSFPAVGCTGSARQSPRSAAISARGGAGVGELTGEGWDTGSLGGCQSCKNAQLSQECTYQTNHTNQQVTTCDQQIQKQEPEAKPMRGQLLTHSTDSATTYMPPLITFIVLFPQATSTRAESPCLYQN